MEEGGEERRELLQKGSEEARGEEKEKVRKGEVHSCSERGGREENQIFVS